MNLLIAGDFSPMNRVDKLLQNNNLSSKDVVGGGCPKT